MCEFDKMIILVTSYHVSYHIVTNVVWNTAKCTRVPEKNIRKKTLQKKFKNSKTFFNILCFWCAQLFTHILITLIKHLLQI